MYIPNGTRHQGLFGYTTATISNFDILCGEINGTDTIGGLTGRADGNINNVNSDIKVSGNNSVGGLAGVARGDINNVKVSGSVIGTGNNVGGLTGNFTGSTITSSNSTGDVIGTGNNVGGLAGNFTGSTIISSNSTGDVSGINNVGGIAGRAVSISTAGSTIELSYSIGKVNGQDSVGGLIGKMNGTVKSSHSIGDVNGLYAVGGLTGCMVGNITGEDSDTGYTTFSKGKITGSNHVGGIVGKGRRIQFSGGVSKVYSLGDVEGWGSVGGIAGSYWGVKINNVKASGRVSGRSEDNSGDWFIGELIGGLIGEMSDGEIDSSYYTGEGVSGGDYVGGFVGAISDRISIRYSNYTGGEVRGRDYVGGLVGGNYSGTTGWIESSNYTGGKVSGNNQVGGLAGYISGISNSYSYADVVGQDNVGGLAGIVVWIYSSHSLKSVNGRNQVGGLAGITTGDITNSYSKGDVRGVFQVGGLIGVTNNNNNFASIEDCYSLSNVIGDDNVGGLVGSMRGNRTTIQNSYAKGNVTGDLDNSSSGNDNLGGLVGYAYSGRILRSFATGNVSGATRLGGLVGRADSLTINQAFSRGNVSANVENPEAPQDNWIGGFFAGGLVGHIGGTCNITEAYSTGKVTVVAVGGGFVGNQETGRTLNLNNCYFDMETSGQTNGVGNGTARLTGNTTAEMKTQATFIGWNFNNEYEWGIDSTINDGYPFLRGVGYDVQPTSIKNIKKSDNRYGIRFTVNPVSDKAEINVMLPNNEKAVETKVVVYDMTGNVVFSATARDNVSWDLRNSAGRFVANGAYLVIAEVKDRSGRVYQYSARLGVKR